MTKIKELKDSKPTNFRKKKSVSFLYQKNRISID